jgi:hypothetical protein
MADPLTRRALLSGAAGLGVAGLGLTACAAATSSNAPSRQPSPADPSASASTGWPPSATWQPEPGQLVPEALTAAVRHVEDHGRGPGRWIQVLKAQYGGLLADTASVLVVTRTWARSGDRIVDGGRTFDVRVARTDRGWRVTAVHPGEPGPASAQLSAAARRVLGSDRIALPPAARADVRSGAVHDSVLEAMLTLSARWAIDVSVIRSGHPLLVFGTDRPSDHPQGRAFDTWRIDGRSVVRPSTPRPLIQAYMEALAAAGSYNVGGPVLLGAAPQFFSDRTHRDHVHAGFQA